MTIEKMKNASFENRYLTDWQEQASLSIKGKHLDSLTTHTYEEILLKPLYTQDDQNESDLKTLPGQPDYRRGNDASGYHAAPWHIANRLSYESPQDLEEKMKLALSKGQTAIAFEVKQELFDHESELLSVLKDFGTVQPFCINAGLLQGQLLASIEKAHGAGKADIKGFIAADPVAEASQRGSLPENEADFFRKWSTLLNETDQRLPLVKTVLINSSPYHNSGANAVQELAIALATGVYLLQHLLENGWELKKALSKMVFHFSIGSQFFMESSKLRAARLLWNKIAESYGAEQADRKITISAETSFFTKTIFDPYVNILRTGNEAFAAVLGGIQYLHTGTYDEVSGNTSFFSERIARNTQLILKSEAHLAKVADPGGGSWYIESLTRELSERAWSLFLEIDRAGGILEVLKSGWLQAQITAVAEKREEDIRTGKRKIIGTNMYANLAEHPEERSSSSAVESEPEKWFTPLQAKRLAEPYETLRMQADSIAKRTGAEPQIGLICLGELKRYSARAEFISSLLASAGIRSVRSGGVGSASEAVEFIHSNHIKQFIICGADQDYLELGPEIAKEIEDQCKDIRLYVAGLPTDQERIWKTARMKGFIHARIDAVQLLSELLQEMEASR